MNFSDIFRGILPSISSDIIIPSLTSGARDDAAGSDASSGASRLSGFNDDHLTDADYGGATITLDGIGGGAIGSLIDHGTTDYSTEFV